MEAWLNLGHAYRGSSSTTRRLPPTLPRRRSTGTRWSPHLAHAKVQLDLGRIDQATTELNFVVEMEPKNLEALILLGQVSQMPA